MLLLALQILISILTAKISIIGLRKDLRSPKPTTKKDAISAKWFIISLTIASSLIIFYSYYSTEKDKKILNKQKSDLTKHIDSLDDRNYKLNIRLSDSSLKQSKLITQNQVESANKLLDAAANLHELINGSDSIPIFLIYLVNDFTLEGGLKNEDTKSAYDVGVTVSNYNLLNACKIITRRGVKILSRECYIAGSASPPLPQAQCH